MKFFHNRVKCLRNNAIHSVCCFLLLLSLSGCKIDFEAQTVVAPDGSITRTTRYVADEDADKKELETYYDLPSDGTWTTQKGMKYDWYAKKEIEGEIDIYEVTKYYTPGEVVSPDYVRRGKRPGSVSNNEFRLTVHDYVFTKIFDYEERFRDVGSEEGSVIAARKFYTLSIEYFAEQLVQELKEEVSVDQARQALKVIFGPLLTRFVDGIQNEGKAFFESKIFEEEIEGAFETEDVITRVVELLPPPSEDEAGSWNEAITRAFDKTNSRAEDLFIETGLEEELFGVYGFTFFQTYEFKTTLSLPGNIIDSNATKKDGKILSWEFGTSDFLWQDYVLYARSRIIYLGRIALAGVAVLIILGVFGIFVWQSEKRKRAS